MGLEQYARERDAFRASVIRHKRDRTVAVGPNMTWMFEGRLTIQYQVQEMLRIERIFERAGIQEELAAYNPLIPDGGNWKATMLIEYPDPHERAIALASLRGVEDCSFVEVGGDRPRACPRSRLKPGCAPRAGAAARIAAPAACSRPHRR